jgi:DNA-binding beta-propeller fold protein YncE
MPQRHLIGRTLLAFAICLGLSQSFVVIAQSPYHIIDRWKIGGEGGWDALTVDSAAHRLYVTHNTRVEVIDTTTGKPLGAVTGLKGSAHGVALDPDTRLGYISDGKGNATVVFNRDDFSTVATIPVDNDPDAIIYEPLTKTIWCFNAHANDVNIIDPTTRKIISTIKFPGNPEFAVTDQKGIVYVNIEDKAEVLKLDAATKKIAATWSLPGCDGPTGIALDVDGSRVFSACQGKVMSVVDVKTGAQLAKPAICEGPDGAAFDPTHKLAFATCGDGNLAVVDANTKDYKTTEMLTTQKRARNVAYDPATDRVYTVTAEFGPAPAPSAAEPKPRGAVIPGSFVVLVIGR